MFKRDADDSTDVLVEPFHDSLGKLLLRLTVAGLMLFHGVSKILGGAEALGKIEGLLTASGLPEAMAYGVYVGEVVAPVLLILGLFTRLSALVLAFNMVVAIGLAHAGDLFKLNDHGAWAIESAMFYLLTALVIAVLGPGRFSLHRKSGVLA